LVPFVGVCRQRLLRAGDDDQSAAQHAHPACDVVVAGTLRAQLDGDVLVRGQECADPKSAKTSRSELDD
jgi:hypothetical protein